MNVPASLTTPYLATPHLTFGSQCQDRATRGANYQRACKQSSACKPAKVTSALPKTSFPRRANYTTKDHQKAHARVPAVDSSRKSSSAAAINMAKPPKRGGCIREKYPRETFNWVRAVHMWGYYMTTLSSIGFHSPACCIADTLKSAWHIKTQTF